MSTGTSEKKARKNECVLDENERTQETNSRLVTQDLGNSQYDGDPIDYRSKYNELAKSLDEFYGEFKPYVMNEGIGDSLRKLLSEEKDKDPLLLLTYMKHSIKAINRLRENSTADSNTSPKSNSGTAPNNNQLEPLLQKAENDIRQHIRIEHQFRLLVESLEQKVTDLEKEKKDLTVSYKSLLKEMKTDNAKLSEIIRKKENEILDLTKSLKNMEDKFDKDTSGIKSAENKSRSTFLKPIQTSNDEMKQYYESELQMLNTQAVSVEKALALNSPADERVSLLQKELRLIKDSTLKKIQMIESKLKTLATTQDNLLDISPVNQITSLGEGQNENSDPKVQNRLFQYVSEESHKPMTSHGMRNKSGNSNPSNTRANTEMRSFESYRQNTQAQLLKKILNDKRTEPDYEKSMTSITQHREKHTANLSQSREFQRGDPSFDHYFKPKINDTTLKEKDREFPLRSFEQRNSRVSAKLNLGQDTLSRNYSSDKIKHSDLSQGPYNTKSMKQISVVRPKGSHSKVRSSSTSNSAIARNASWSVLHRK